MKKCLFIITLSIISIYFANGCSSCSNGVCGMCTKPGVTLSEQEVRERASTFAFERLKIRQKSGAPIQDEDMKVIAPEPIEPGIWQVTQKENQWLLKRHITRDIWQVVSCNDDGSDAYCYYEVGPAVP